MNSSLQNAVKKAQWQCPKLRKKILEKKAKKINLENIENVVT